MLKDVANICAKKKIRDRLLLKPFICLAPFVFRDGTWHIFLDIRSYILRKRINYNW